ncbi:MAG: SPOR domain-containing protein [Rhodospirillaceae bacterium]|nr:MAG: SPOR domain-containing protein [Rhodospirillaceae bacterium]
MADDFRSVESDRIVFREAAMDLSRHSRRGRHIMTALVAIAAVLGFSVVILYAYNKGRQAAETKVPPLIQAQEGPVKVRPESPGGMEVPNRDKEVFTRLEAEKQPERVERLLPPPEKPMTSAATSAIAPKQGMKLELADGTTAAPKAPSLPRPPTPKLSKNDPKIPGPPPAPTAPAKKPVAKKPPAKTLSAASKPSAGGRYRVQISSLPSEAAIRKSWASIKGKHKDLLGNLPLIVERTVLSAGRGTYYRMQVGPLSSKSQAATLCTRLKQRKLSCLVVRR